MQIQWYPGHMARAQRKIREQVRGTDVLLEIRDARIPLSSANPELEQIAPHKPRIIILNKSDLADPEATREWIRYFGNRGIPAIAVDSLKRRGIRKTEERIRRAGEAMLEKRRARGIRPRPVRVLVAGIPNVGKSSFINAIVRQGAARTGRVPGVTRGNQWIRIHPDIELMDTPGLLWPRIGDERTGLNLAVTGAVREEVIPLQEAAAFLLARYLERRPSVLRDRYGPGAETGTPEESLEQIARNRGFHATDREWEQRTALHVLHDYQTGKLVPLSLELPPGGEETP